MTSREDNRRLAEAYNEAMGIGGTNLNEEVTDDPPTSATITQPVRTRYAPSAKPMANGYTAGKEKAYFEVRTWHPKEHAPSCGCNPCMAARSVIENSLDRYSKMPLSSTSHALR